MTENAAGVARRITFVFEFSDGLGWEVSHDVPEDAPAWSTVNALALNNELQLNKTLDDPRQLTPWQETREEIIRLTGDFVDLAHARAGHVVQHITRHYGAPPFDERDVWHYQRELLGLDRPPAYSVALPHEDHGLRTGQGVSV